MSSGRGEVLDVETENDEMEPNRGIVVREFEGCPVTAVNFRGRWLWSAVQVGEAIGYKEGRYLVNKVRDDWKDEFSAGNDYELFKGEDLAEFKSFLDCGDSPQSRNPQRGARSMLVFTESGVDLALVLSRTEKGRRLRRLLVDHILPQLRATGTATLPGAAPLASAWESLPPYVLNIANLGGANLGDALVAHNLLEATVARFHGDRTRLLERAARACARLAARNEALTAEGLFLEMYTELDDAATATPPPPSGSVAVAFMTLDGAVPQAASETQLQAPAKVGSIVRDASSIRATELDRAEAVWTPVLRAYVAETKNLMEITLNARRFQAVGESELLRMLGAGGYRADHMILRHCMRGMGWGWTRAALPVPGKNWTGPVQSVFLLPLS